MADDDSKWTKPSNPPPPLFLGESERDLVKQVNDELIERVIGQAITYLPISMQRTNFHPLYGEAIEKSFLPPVRVYALVEFPGITTTTDHYGLDKEYPITVRFHERRLYEDQDLYVREGDYVQYGTSFFEIVSLKEDRQLFGQVDHLFQIEAKCIKTRKGLIDLNVLPSDTIAAILEASEATEESSLRSGPPTGPARPGRSSVARVCYVSDVATDIAADTSLNGFLGVGSLSLTTAAVYEDGLRQNLTGLPATGDYYIDGGTLYSVMEIEAGQRVLLEVLTLV
jgi:hypothetical protein